METFCILCREPIPEDRQRRGAVTCSTTHAMEYRRQRRDERALRFCRLCGRPARKVKPLKAVLHEHSGLFKNSTRDPQKGQAARESSQFEAGNQEDGSSDRA